MIRAISIDGAVFISVIDVRLIFEVLLDIPTKAVTVECDVIILNNAVRH